jgi:fatty acid desaturase
MVHHQYTSIRGKDTELETLRPEREPFTVSSFLWIFSALAYFPSLCRLLLSHTWGKIETFEAELFEPRDIKRFILEARIHVVAYATLLAISIYYGSWIIVQLWLAPMICFKFVHNVQNYAEHYGLPKVANVMDSTRTIYTTPINRWLVWNMTYHTAHHRFANIPFYNLPEANRLIRKHVRHALPGYLPFLAKMFGCALRGKRYGYEGLM